MKYHSEVEGPVINIKKQQANFISSHREIVDSSFLDISKNVETNKLGMILVQDSEDLQSDIRKDE